MAADARAAEAVVAKIDLDGGSPRLQWNSQPGQTYAIQVRDALGGGEWETIATLTAEESTTSWTDTLPASARRYYRISYEIEQTLAAVALPIPFEGLEHFESIELPEMNVSIDAPRRAIVLTAEATLFGQAAQLILLGVWGDDAEPARGFAFGVKFPQFKFSDWATGLSGTVLEDLIDELPEDHEGELPDHFPDLPEGPFEVSSEDLHELAKKFYEREFAEPSFELGLELGGNFRGAFPQSRLPAPVLEALGMDPEAEALLEGSLNMRLGALAGGSFLALERMSLQATLPLPTRPRIGFPDWLGSIESGERFLRFDYEDPRIEVTVIDQFSALLDGLSLRASLPPVSPPGSPEWFVSGELALEITSQPSVGFVGEITTLIEDDALAFSVGATIQRVGPNVEFALAGGLKAAEPWEEPFGIEWMIFNEAAVKVSVNAVGSITLGFAGDLVVGEKDIDVAVAATVNASGVPTNFLFDGASEAGLEMADLVALQQAMARVGNADAPRIPLDEAPEMAVRRLKLKFAPREDPDLGVEAGFAIAGDLWLPSELDGPPERNFAGVEISVGADGIVGKGRLGAFELGPVAWEDALFDLSLSLAEQHLFISGSAEVGSLFQGDLDLGVTRDAFEFATSAEIFGQFEAQLDAEAPFSFADPEFTVSALLENDFNGAIVAELTQRMKQRANASVAIADKMLRRGLTGWSGFRNDPQSLNFGGRMASFAGAAGWPTSQWKPYTDAIQDKMEEIALLLPGDQNYLDLALGGVTIPGVPGLKTTGLFGQQFCNGIPYGGGPCWTVEPIAIGGACNEPSLSQYNLSCSSGPFIEQTLIPPLVSRIESILSSQGRAPMIVIERAAFTASLEGLLSSPQVDLAVRAQFMQGSTRLNMNSSWDFNDRAASLDALRDALANAL